MNKLLERFKYHCFLIYCLVVYSFFTQRMHKKYSNEEDNKVENQLTLRSYTSSEINSKETKILLDLKYKDRISLLSHELFSCSLDIEGKLLGYRIIHKQNITSNLNNPIIHLNKKLTHSTLFGSIKLIKL